MLNPFYEHQGLAFVRDEVPGALTIHCFLSLHDHVFARRGGVGVDFSSSALTARHWLLPYFTKYFILELDCSQGAKANIS